jgi:hypothetical protein
MPDHANNSNAAFQELVRVLEGAVQAGVDSIVLEYKGRDLVVFYRAGNVGIGAGTIAKELQAEVLDELRTRTGLKRKSKGKMPVTLLGREFEVAVERHQLR